jgi:hypothetical protein
MEDWVGSKTGLDDMEKRKIFPLAGIEVRTLRRPACSGGKVDHYFFPERLIKWYS